MTITPAMATKWLEATVGSRNINQRKVSEFSLSMQRERWILNAEPIIISTDGKLIDGHHRLWACLLSGCSFRSVVLTGVPTSVHVTIDSGSTRTIGTVMTISGIPNGNQVGAIAALVMAYDQGKAGENRGRAPNAGARQDIISYAEENIARIHDSISAARSATHVFRLTPLGASHYIFSRISPDQADDFFSKLAEGDNLSKSNPIHRVREQLLRYKSGMASFPNALALAVLIKSWNAVRAGETDRTGKVFSWKAGDVYPKAK